MENKDIDNQIKEENKKNDFKQSLSFFKEKILPKAILLLLLFIILTFFMYFVFKSNMNVVEELMKSFADMTQNLVDKGKINTVSLILFNMRASLVSILYGIVPFLFFGLMGVFVNSAIMGAAIAMMESKTAIFKMILFGILPHGIFEITALCISWAMSFELCLFLTKKILKKEKRNLNDLGKNMVIIYITIIVPLLIIAGIIEANITPIFIKNI